MITILSNQQSKQPLNILLVEDDDGDAKAVKRAFSKAEITNTITRAEDGVEALDILRGKNGHNTLSAPYILLLDLNMPRMDGFELLATLRADDRLKKTIVFILTTSKRDEDKNLAYNKNVAGYIVKETAGRDFLKLVDMIGNYWCLVELPE
jgi:CheY-like chemotaxis protein